MNCTSALKTYGIMLVISPFLLSLSYPNIDGVHIDVKCTLYGNGDTDVRIYVMGLKGNTEYTAEIIPDHNPPFTVTSETDTQGILWVVPKVQNGGISLDFKVSIYEGKDVSNLVVITGDDDAPCRSLTIKDHTSIRVLMF